MFRAQALLLALGLIAAAQASIFETSLKDIPAGKMSAWNIGGTLVKRFDNLYGRLHYRYNSLRHAPERVYVGGFYQLGTANVHVEAGFDVANKTVLGSVIVRADSTTVRARIDSRDKLTHLDLQQQVRVGNKRAIVHPSFDFKTRSMGFKTSLELDGKNTFTELEYDGLSRNYWLRFAHRLDKDNMVAPTLNMRTGETKFSWIRYLGGESRVEATLEPLKRLELNWVDPGYNGAWHTSAVIPWDKPSQSSVAFRRTWEL